jgi:DNA-binding IclR family transcriptional regulator
MENSRRVRAVDNATSILLALAADGHAVGVSDVARRVGLDKSTVSRTLRTLAEVGFVAKDEQAGRYRLGMAIVRLAQVALDGLDLRQTGQEYIEAIGAETGETSHLAVWSEDAATIIGHVPGRHPIRAPGAVGERMPAHCTSLGKVLLAFQPQSVIDRILAAALARYTPATITDPQRLNAELRAIRSTKVGYNNGEFRVDAVAVAAPVWDHQGRLAAAISASGPAYRLTGPTMAKATTVVRLAAQQLSAGLGAPATLMAEAAVPG